jgi:hypothetical protein
MCVQHKKKVTDVRGWLTANARTVTELRRGGMHM